eukprot:Nitzschia sp. Nitz4//scaffold62_size106224//36559//38517//NITZ4_004350-RA/size106224-augustus-gene-0.89-mRNA-1//1//CDS//3329555838//3742//frame0
MTSIPVDYYNSGSTELVQESALTMKKLETRRKLTKDANRLVLVLVGLPARGKSFVARKLMSFLEWNGCACKIFNVGKYRRRAYAEMSDSTTGACDADFFDSNNKQATAIREKAARMALDDMLRWLDDDEVEGDDKDEASYRSYNSATTFGAQENSDRIAIFDATNSTDERRMWVLDECTSPAKRPGKPTGLIFVESICDDKELLMENFRTKVTNSPDYKDMPEEEAMADLQLRVSKYEEQYETITDDSLSYIKIFNLSTKLMVNHIYGRMSKIIVPALMAWNIGSRPIFLCRAGQTLSDVAKDNDDMRRVNLSDNAFASIPSNLKKRLMQADQLGNTGKKFSDALYDHVFEQGVEYVQNRSDIMDMATGTDVDGLAGFGTSQEPGDGAAPFPLKILTSTMPRASQTVRWDEYDFKIEELSNLNPLDKGDFAGKELEELQATHPSWYTKLEKQPFKTRFPGGESYRDVVKRVASVVVDIEQQVIPTLVVSHVSVLQTLIAYFRRSPIDKCMSIEVPLHTVIQFTPSRGGGWTETQVCLAPTFPPEEQNSNAVKIDGLDKLGHSTSSSSFNNATSPSPIWGDHMRKGSTVSLASSRNSSG